MGVGCGCGDVENRILEQSDIPQVLDKSWNEAEKNLSSLAERESAITINCESQSDLRFSPSWIRNMFESLGQGDEHSSGKGKLLSRISRGTSLTYTKILSMRIL